MRGCVGRVLGPRPALFLLAWAAATWTPGALCGERRLPEAEPDVRGREQRPGEAAEERKHIGMFSHRPVKNTPGEQLAYARSLEEKGDDGAAESEYLALVRQWHESAEAASAQLAYAQLIEKRGANRDAFAEYQYLIEHFTGSFRYEEILDRQLRIARAIMGERDWTFFGLFSGFPAPERALSLFETIVANAPNWEKSAEVQFEIGVIHENNGEYFDAVLAYEKAWQKHPTGAVAPQASFRRARCMYREADDNRRDEQRCREALSALVAFVLDYSSDPNVDEARQYVDILKERYANMYYDRALFYDRIARRPQSAAIAYADFLKKFPNSSRSEEVRLRMQDLQAKPGGEFRE